jgi:hypothetical protein
LRLGEPIGYISNEPRACGLAPVGGGVTIPVLANLPLDDDVERSGCRRERSGELVSSAAGGGARHHGFSTRWRFASNLMV